MVPDFPHPCTKCVWTRVKWREGSWQRQRSAWVEYCIIIEDLNSFKYLGSTLAKDGSSLADVPVRMATTSAMARVDKLWRSQPSGTGQQVHTVQVPPIHILMDLSLGLCLLTQRGDDRYLRPSKEAAPNLLCEMKKQWLGKLTTLVDHQECSRNLNRR